MNCRKVQKRILENYCLGKGNRAGKQKFDDHIEKCEKCAEFAGSLERHVLEPLGAAQRFSPPDRVWDNVVNAVRKERRPSFLEILSGKIPLYPMAGRTVFAAATVVALVFMALFTAGYREVRDRRSGEFLYDEIMFFFASEDINGHLLDDTGILTEEFFL